MKAEILTIGDELLIGQVVNTNAAFLARAMNTIGIHVERMNTVSDDPADIIAYLNEASDRADLVISTGGLGPTRDDTAKEAYCRFTEDILTQNPEVLAHIEHLFEKYITTPISERNRLQAMVPSRARVLHNPYGTAPGLWMEKYAKVYIALPGVPYEMQNLMENEVLPRLRQRFSLPAIVHRTLLTYGLGESAIADRIEDVEDSLPDHIKLAYLPNAGKVRLRLSGRGKEAEVLQNELEGIVKELYNRIGDIIVGEEGKEDLPVRIGGLLKSRGWRLSTAESLTGGRIASALVEPSGASDFFQGGAVTYATEIKINLLGVSQATIDRYTVVSEQVALEMAQSAAKKFQSEVAVSVTGVAGPDPGESGQPVGTVWIGMHSPRGTFAEVFSFGNNRERITLKTVNKSLELLYRELQKK